VKRLLAAGALLCCVLLGGAANAAYVKTGNLVLKADGGFTPQQLPRQAYAPISFKGYADLEAVDGTVPPPLTQLVLEFDRDGKLSTGGLATCQPAALQEVTTPEARALCHGAIVGSGHVSALVALAAQAPVHVSSPVTLFNGPRQDGKPTVIFHARTTVPAPQSLVITIPIEERRGLYRYRATIDIPPIADGHGSLVHLDAAVSRRYRFGGKERSYVSARCGDNVFRTHGRFTFADGTIIDGEVFKGCTVR
jgi:hypothetical protein